MTELSEAYIAKFVHSKVENAAEVHRWCTQAIQIVKNYPDSIPAVYLELISDQCDSLGLKYLPVEKIHLTKPEKPLIPRRPGVSSSHMRWLQLHLIDGAGHGYDALQNRLRALLVETREAKPGNTGSEVDDSEPAVPDEAILPTLLSASDIAYRVNRKRESVTSFLTRHAEKNPECRIENPSKRRNEPGYLYRTSDVWPALEKWVKSGAAS